MNPSARLFNCARCHCQVIICRRCDRGQVYCAEGCADLARITSRRRAGKRYSTTRRGRHNNAERQRRFRVRQQDKVPTVGALGDASGFRPAGRPCSTAQHSAQAGSPPATRLPNDPALPYLSQPLRSIPAAPLLAPTGAGQATPGTAIAAPNGRRQQRLWIKNAIQRFCATTLWSTGG